MITVPNFYSVISLLVVVEELSEPFALERHEIPVDIYAMKFGTRCTYLQLVRRGVVVTGSRF